MTRYSHPMRVYSTSTGWTWGVLALEEATEFCTWDEDAQRAVPLDPASLGCIVAGEATPDVRQ